MINIKQFFLEYLKRTLINSEIVRGVLLPGAPNFVPLFANNLN